MTNMIVTVLGVAAIAILCWLVLIVLGKLVTGRIALGRRYNGYSRAEWAALQEIERKKAEKEMQGEQARKLVEKRAG